MTKKIAISLPDRTLKRARAAVKNGKAPNISNYIASLINRESAAESFEEMIAAWLRETGSTEQEIRAARRDVAMDFERAGIVSKDVHRGKAARRTG